MITLAIDGKQYQTYESISFGKSLDDITGSFEFSFAKAPEQTLPFKVDSICQIYIDNVKMLEGRIEVINGNGSSNKNSISVSGRSTLADIVDSTIGGNIEFKAPISLVGVANQTLSKLGITGIKVINNVPGLADFSSSDLISAKTGQNLFEFLEGYARKRQVLISSNNIDTIIFTRASTTLNNTPLIHKVANDSNNVESYDFSYDITKRFNQYVFWSQGNPTTDPDAVNFNITVSTVSVKDKATDSEIHPNRILNQLSEQSTDQDGLNDRAAWELNVRKARSFTYSAQVTGHYNQNKQLWDINKLIKVIDDFAGVNSSFLINSVKFELSAQGSCTHITVVRPDAYSLPPPSSNKNKNKNQLAPVYDPNAK